MKLINLFFKHQLHCLIIYYYKLCFDIACCLYILLLIFLY
ncbi:hypothetical protein A1OE_415 [Candidatus Endolissoclinum faulkneri L2]|uniref:Uncharacterized protein n=1 Tax=Candidatus Endolissoclinum faulkneri L2 TaxID=1193729 RepID=K7Z3P0_9PROT|nr:hypothetical protein A1OE_415 [Candidatus Endolissoclinum faulkneri L2]